VSFIIKYVSAFITGLSQATHPSNMYKDEELRVITLTDVIDKREKIYIFVVTDSQIIIW